MQHIQLGICGPGDADALILLNFQIGQALIDLILLLFGEIGGEHAPVAQVALFSKVAVLDAPEALSTLAILFAHPGRSHCALLLNQHLFHSTLVRSRQSIHGQTLAIKSQSLLIGQGLELFPRLQALSRQLGLGIRNLLFDGQGIDSLDLLLLQAGDLLLQGSLLDLAGLLDQGSSLAVVALVINQP